MEGDTGLGCLHELQRDSLVLTSGVEILYCSEGPSFGTSGRSQRTASILLVGGAPRRAKYIFQYLRNHNSNKRKRPTCFVPKFARDSCHHVTSQHRCRSFCLQKRQGQSHLDWQKKRKPWSRCVLDNSPNIVKLSTY